MQAVVPWRRRDAYVTTADTFIVAANPNGTVAVSKCFRNDSSLTSTDATFTFNADAGSASYFLYYLPFTTCEYAGGSCEYGANVNYAPRSHCADSPWWPAGTPLLAPSAVAYEAVSDFDAFTATEILMSPAEQAAFLAAAAPPPPLHALLIAETAGNATRVWGSAGATAGGGAPPAPFCDWGGAAGAYFLKTGGDPSKTEGWDQGFRDKCCSVDPTDCVWFNTLAGCQAHSPAACRQCAPGAVDMGCPSWASQADSALPLASKYLGVPPTALASASATLVPNQNFSWQALVVAPADEFLTVQSVSFAPDVPGVTFACLSTQVCRAVAEAARFVRASFTPPLPLLSRPATGGRLLGQVLFAPGCHQRRPSPVAQRISRS